MFTWIRRRRIRLEALQWAYRQQDGLSCEQEAVMTAWREQSPEHLQALLEIRTGIHFQTRWRRFMADRSPPTDDTLPTYVIVILALLVALGVVIWLEHLPASQPTPIRNLEGPPLQVLLVDGSTLVMNTNSSMSVEEWPIRGVDLTQGELYLEVMEGRPFVLHVDDWTLRTSAAVYGVVRDPQGIGLLVKAGEVDVMRTDDPKVLQRLFPHQTLELHKTGKLQVTPISDSELEDRLQWRNTLQGMVQLQ